MCNETERKILEVTCYIYKTRLDLRDYTSVNTTDWCTAIREELTRRDIRTRDGVVPTLGYVGCVANLFRETVEIAPLAGIYNTIINK